eukprot:467284-Prorocentrum_minimum.AAC.3
MVQYATAFRHVRDTGGRLKQDPHLCWVRHTLLASVLSCTAVLCFDGATDLKKLVATYQWRCR